MTSRMRKDKRANWSISSREKTWRAVHGQSIPPHFPPNKVRNMTTKDNTGTLPINLYAVGPLDVQPLDLIKLYRRPSFSTTHVTERRNRVFEHVESDI